MELGFVICAQIFILAAFTIIPMMVLRRSATQSHAPAPATSPAPARARIRD